MVLGSHNTMSYLPPAKWWQHILRPFYRCQVKTLEQQIESGVTYFDLRIREGKPNQWVFAHGCVTFKGCSLREAINIISNRVPNATIRLIYEGKANDVITSTFKTACHNIEQTYPNIQFVGGFAKQGWQQLYKFRGDDGSEPMQWVGSMQPMPPKDWWKRPWRYYGSLLPCLWAALNNYKLYTDPIADDKVVLLDFV